MSKVIKKLLLQHGLTTSSSDAASLSSVRVLSTGEEVTTGVASDVVTEGVRTSEVGFTTGGPVVSFDSPICEPFLLPICLELALAVSSVFNLSILVASFFTVCQQHKTRFINLCKFYAPVSVSVFIQLAYSSSEAIRGATRGPHCYLHIQREVTGQRRHSNCVFKNFYSREFLNCKITPISQMQNSKRQKCNVFSQSVTRSYRQSGIRRKGILHKQPDMNRNRKKCMEQNV